MASVVVTPTARRNLEVLIRDLSLPESTVDRFRRSIESLGAFPLLGAQLPGRWSRFRFVPGPWRWMIVVYAYDEDADEVAIVTIRDARSAASPTSQR